MSDNDLPELKPLTQTAKELGLKASSLRTEIRRGRLRPIVIAGRFYLTPDLVREMLDACRLPPPKHSEPVTPDDQSPRDPEIALAAAMQTLQALKQTSRARSRKDRTSRR